VFHSVRNRELVVFIADIHLCDFGIIYALFMTAFCMYY